MCVCEVQCRSYGRGSAISGSHHGHARRSSLFLSLLLLLDTHTIARLLLVVGREKVVWVDRGGGVLVEFLNLRKEAQCILRKELIQIFPNEKGKLAGASCGRSLFSSSLSVDCASLLSVNGVYLRLSVHAQQMDLKDPSIPSPITSRKPHDHGNTEADDAVGISK